MSNKVGRPSSYKFSKNEKEEILEHIIDYHENYNTHSTIRYKHIHEHFQSLYEQGKFNKKTSYDFWKRKGRLGRELVDEVNAINHESIQISETEKIDLIDIKDLISKFGGNNKEILWEHLEPYNHHINQFIKLLDQQKQKINKLESSLEQEKQQNIDLKEENDKVQELLFSFFTYSNKENELVNMLNVGQSKSNLINAAIEHTFSEPDKFYNELTKHIKNHVNIANRESYDKSNVIPLKKENKATTPPEYDL